MRTIIVTLAALLSLSASGAANAATVRIGGSGGMIPMVTELGKAYMKKNPTDTIDVNQKSLGKEGGLMALLKGNVEIAMLANLEAKDKSQPITPVEIAIIPALFAVHPSVTVKALSGQQICDIYAGKITNWSQVGSKSAPIVVLSRPENESAKIAVRQGLGCFAALTEVATVINLAKSNEMRDALIKTPNAIGMINSVALADAGSKVIAIRQDGKDVLSTPTVQWPMKSHTFLATGKNSGETAKKFIQFIKSPEGQKIIKSEKAVPVQ